MDFTKAVPKLQDALRGCKMKQLDWADGTSAGATVRVWNASTQFSELTSSSSWASISRRHNTLDWSKPVCTGLLGLMTIIRASLNMQME